MEDNYNSSCSFQLVASINNFQRINELIEFNMNNNNNENDKVRILDIGCSLGLNSIYQVNSIISEIRKHDTNKLVEVYHSDLPNNNFSILFDVIGTNPHSYSKKYKNVYSFAIGKSFLSKIMPNESCDIIFSYNTFHWGDQFNPIFQFNKNLFIYVNPLNYPPGFNDYGKEYLFNILNLRYDELKKNGIFSCNFLSYDSKNPLSLDFENVLNNFKDTYREMANDGLLSHKEVDSMFWQFILYNNEQVEYAIEKVKEKGLILINKEQVLTDWDKTNNGKGLENLIGYMPVFIKRTLKCSESHFNQLHEEFKSRVYKKYNQNPKMYNFTLTLDLLLFKKIK